MSEELNQATKDLSLETQEVSDVQDAEGETKKTLLSDPDFEVKHPLNSRWTLWYTKPPTDSANESWADLLKPIITFSTVEEFWGIYNSLPQAAELPLKADYHLFREGIKPEWEDAANAEGGKWSYQFKEKRNLDINDLWLRALLSVIGETIEEDEGEVNGVVFNNRRFAYRIALWTKTINKPKLFPIGETFKKVLKLEEQDSVEFMTHKDSEVRGAKPILMI